VIVAHVHAPAPRVSSLLPHCQPVLDSLIARLLAKSPEDRFADAESLQQTLRERAFHAHKEVIVREMGIPGTNRTAPVVLTSREAEEVRARAAQRQVNTGMISPPPLFSPRRDAPQVTSGYDASIVQASAIDAGIDREYVERAMEEKAEAARVSATVIVSSELMQRPQGWFAGARTTLEYTASLDGELDGDDFEGIAEHVQRALGEPHWWPDSLRFSPADRPLRRAPGWAGTV